MCVVQVYPTLVIRGTGLYELWKKGLYRNYEPTQLIDLVARILALVPPWVRIYRIQVPLPHPHTHARDCSINIVDCGTATPGVSAFTHAFIKWHSTLSLSSLDAVTNHFNMYFFVMPLPFEHKLSSHNS